MSKMCRVSPVLLFMTLNLTGCMGIGIPFTSHRFLNIPVDISRNETNTTCTNIDALATVANELEVRHLKYLQSRDQSGAMDIDLVLHSLGEDCIPLFTRLDISQIKTELFGDVNIIPDPDRLSLLGGYVFFYSNTLTRGGLEVTLHLDKASTGPERKMVAVYELSSGKVIHFNYSGTDNLATKSRSWPLDQFFGLAVGAAGKVVIP